MREGNSREQGMRTDLTETETTMFVVVVVRERLLEVREQFWRTVVGGALPRSALAQDVVLALWTIRLQLRSRHLSGCLSGRPSSQQTPSRVSRLLPRPRPPFADPASPAFPPGEACTTSATDTTGNTESTAYQPQP
jgi:hypothetical protein